MPDFCLGVFFDDPQLHVHIEESPWVTQMTPRAFLDPLVLSPQVVVFPRSEIHSPKKILPTFLRTFNLAPFEAIAV
jgi:hypothetical protein